MKDGVVIKAMWLLLGGAAKASLLTLGVDDPKTFWKESKKIYRREMDKLTGLFPFLQFMQKDYLRNGRSTDEKRNDCH